ncbi:MAG TPA: glycoside hydrolase family 3 C-terminal domain-containing protein [Bacteroidales bacterium]|nr:glycoside hydrolase family 3 C-terminal domain-containing protein [Bacteroidales bacterium]
MKQKMRFTIWMMAVFTILTGCTGTRYEYPYLNPNLSIEERVDDLVSRMTLEQKVSQMVADSKAIDSLHVPAYHWWNECLHGVGRAGIATVFPQAIGLGATWDTSLIYQVADVISTEARAKHHEFARNNKRGIYQGLTFWSPNINIFRDPRWGRGQETYGEDPYLTGRIGVKFVEGLQGNDPKYFKVIATAKHYAVHSGPEPLRHVFDARVSDQDLWETYLPAFEDLMTEAKAYSIMGAYNAFRGEACNASRLLLDSILRQKWNFQGYVVSDCGAIDDIYLNHKHVATQPEAAALAVKRGCDLNCENAYLSLTEAVKKGFITEKEIDVAVKRLFTARFKLGMFDPQEMVPYAKIPISKNDAPEHRELAKKTAEASMVLLKNEGNLLPLDKSKIKTVAVVGPNANDIDVLYGNYNGFASKPVTILDGIKNKLGSSANVLFEKGTPLHEAWLMTLETVPGSNLSFNGKPGLQGEYFNNKDLQGKPVTTRIDAALDLNEGKFKEIKGLNTENISARWTGKLSVDQDGEYFVGINGDDGYRLFIDNKKVVENWDTHSAELEYGTVKLNKGSHDIKVEYFQGTGGYTVKLAWSPAAKNMAEFERNMFNKALDIARKADIVIYAGGISPNMEGEEMGVDISGFKGGDRTSLDLPAIQERFLKALKATGKPIVFVLMNGSAISINWADANIPAILEAWYPGEEGGNAVADILFGDYNPAGRLPLTFYKGVDQLPPFEDYNMKNRTYRYFTGDPLYKFGYGLSYSTFAYSNLKVASQVKAGEEIKVSIDVENKGKMAGDEVVQLYISHPNADVTVANLSLQGFRRIHLKPGEKQTVELTLKPKQYSVFAEGKGLVPKPGIVALSIGGSQPNDKKAVNTQVLSARFEVTK